MITHCFLKLVNGDELLFWSNGFWTQDATKRQQDSQSSCLPRVKSLSRQTCI